MMNKYFKIVMLLISLAMGTSVIAAQNINPNDPYEKFNRVMYTFNEGFDTIILRPVSLTYVKIMPKPLVKCIANFFNNIDTVPTVLNDVLQANLYQATSDSWRLVINSTVGILGFFDVATMIGLEPNTEDFGLTLARWGYKNSNYLVIPFLGPSTTRDAIAWPINYEFLTIYPYIYPKNERYQIYMAGVISRRAEFIRYENLFAQAAVDKYTFMRDAYMQRRAYLIQRNEELGDPYLDKNSKLDPPRL